MWWDVIFCDGEFDCVACCFAVFVVFGGEDDVSCAGEFFIWVEDGMSVDDLDFYVLNGCCCVD